MTYTDVANEMDMNFAIQSFKFVPHKEFQNKLISGNNIEKTANTNKLNASNEALSKPNKPNLSNKDCLN
jgi:hypothetical protein